MTERTEDNDQKLENNQKQGNNQRQENNQVYLAGEIVSECRFSHEVFGEGFYMVDVSVERLSGSYDVIPVMISERIFDVEGDHRCEGIRIFGQFRSYNDHAIDRSRLVLTVFARDVELLEQCPEKEQANEIFLDGYVCREPSYRITPKGREISDMLVAVNRAYGRSDYIPCICWGRNARYMAGYEIGGRVQIWGRIQSREYTKKGETKKDSIHVAYEVSVSKMG